MAAEKFLEQVASYYCKCRENSDLADLIFVLPNKRSAMFLKRYFQIRLSGNVMRCSFMPRFTTFGKFLSRRAALREASNYDKLFTLYHSYTDILREMGREKQIKDFDRFIFWGDMILNDFDEIDMSLADPSKVYKNLEALKEITADYLSETQKEVIRDIWGETPLTSHIDHFWLHTQPGGTDDNDRPVARKFIALWQVLDRIYKEFTHRLKVKGMATRGQQARMAVKQVETESAESLRRNHFVFVGLSDLSTAEVHIMKRLKDIGCADFFWDLPPGSDSLLASTPVMDIINRLASQFPMPADFDIIHASEKPEINVIGVPSAIGQAKQAANLLTKWINDGVMSTNGDIETSIVLPDQSLLLPLILALPPGLQKINVTMSVPMGSTTFATLLRVIIAMQTHLRKRRDGSRTFFFKDVLEVLLHPHVQLIASAEAEKIRTDIRNNRLYNIDVDELNEKYKSLNYIFQPVIDPNDVDSVYHYTIGLINGLKNGIEKTVGTQAFNNSFEIEILDSYAVKIQELYDVIKEYGIEMQESTFFMMLEKSLSSSSLQLNGTPLEGVQIMGVLETRALDFDNIVVLSMNERTFPRRDYVKTMIPNSLRRGYGLQPIERREGFYAYYFFRMISRASHAALFYDSRAGHRGGGEMSRYLTQLFFLHNNGNVKHLTVANSGLQPDQRVITVAKNQEVLEELSTFTKPGGRFISASALKAYMACPLSFYLKYVKGLRDDNPPEGYMTAAMLGNIFHYTMKDIYQPYEGKIINAGVIDSMLDHDKIHAMVMKNIRKEALRDNNQTKSTRLNAEAYLMAASVTLQVEMMLAAEKEKYCQGQGFTYVKGEMDYQANGGTAHDIENGLNIGKQWQITPDLSINFRMMIDRIDRDENGILRFIDYKTGTDYTSIGDNIGNLFTGNHDRNGIFQLMLYCEAYNDMIREGETILPVIHQLRDIASTGRIPDITYNRGKLQPYPAMSAIFRPMLEDVIASIFNKDIPFTQCEDTKGCRFCPFINMCGKTVSLNDL